MLGAWALLTLPGTAAVQIVQETAVQQEAAAGQEPPAQASAAVVEESPPQPAAAPCCTIPALTPVELEIMTPASSKTSRQGEEIQIRLVEPIIIDGKTIVPAGITGTAVVIQASPGGLGGKAGELVIGMPYLKMGNQQIGLKRLRYGPATGRGRDTAALAAVVAIGLPGLLISGGRVEIKSGTRANAMVSSDTTVQVAE
jgi:hypothetical protein